MAATLYCFSSVPLYPFKVETTKMVKQVKQKHIGKQNINFICTVITVQ